MYEYFISTLNLYDDATDRHCDGIEAHEAMLGHRGTRVLAVITATMIPLRGVQLPRLLSCGNVPGFFTSN